MPSWPGNKIATAPHKRTEEDSQCDLQSLGFLMTKQTLSLHFSLPYFITHLRSRRRQLYSKACHHRRICWRVGGQLGGTKSFAIIHVAASCGECGLCKVHRLRSPSFRLQATARHHAWSAPGCGPSSGSGRPGSDIVPICPTISVHQPGSFPKQGKLVAVYRGGCFCCVGAGTH